MKKINFLYLLLLGYTLTSYSQDSKKEQIKAAKVAFITNELNLTSTEAEKFWPIFNAFEDKQQELKRQKIKGYLLRFEIDNISEKEASEMVTSYEKNEEELHQIRKKFVINLKAVIPSIKILKLKKAEEEFSKKLLRQYKEKRG